MIDFKKFLENRSQLIEEIPNDFSLPLGKGEDSLKLDIELDFNGYTLILVGSVRCFRSYYRGETNDLPSESEDSYTVEILEGKIYNREDDKVKDLNGEELKICAKTIENLY